MERIMKGEYDFTKDIAKGEIGEDTIIKYMINLGFLLTGKCNDNRYDFSMAYKGNVYTYELKTDMYCTPESDTGNIVAEVECRGKASGLAVTQADFFVTYFPHLGEIWNIRSNDLRKLIADNNIKLKEGKGDPGSNTKFYLINKETYRPHFRVHKIG